MNSCLLATSRSNVPRPKLLRNLRTYDLSETIEATSHGVTSKSMKNLSDPDFWTWDMTMVALGKCYTLNYSSNLTMDQERDSLLFQLSPNKSARFFFHESDFFISTFNPLSLPTTKEHIGSSHFKTLILELTRWEKINRPEAPCNPSTDRAGKRLINRLFFRSLRPARPSGPFRCLHSVTHPEMRKAVPILY